MGLSDSQKVDFLYKLLQSRGFTSVAKNVFEEQFKGVSHQVFSEDIWLEASSIPLTPPGGSTSIVEVFDTLELTPDESTPANRIWVACSTPGDLETRISATINPNRFGKGYKVVFFEDDGLGGAGDRIYDSDPSEPVFFYEYGILAFMNDPSLSGWSFPIHAKLYQYVGLTGTPVVEVDKHFSFNGVASTSWVISHSLNKRPSVTVVDGSGNILLPDTIVYNTVNQLTLTFLDAQTGTAYLN